MKPEPLLASFAKIERANSQIDELNSRINEFFKARPYELSSKLDRKTAIEVWRFRLTKRLPGDLPIIVGETLHNLRSPLDQMLSAVVLQTHPSADKVAFPFGRNIDAFEDALRKQKKLPSDAIPLIRQAQPYNGGNDLLWLLHRLNRGDKHRPALVPINLYTATTMSTLIIWKGHVLTVGFRHGRHLVFDGFNLTQPDPDKQLMIVRNGEIIRVNGQPAVLFEPNVGAGDDDMEVMTAVRGTEFHGDFQPSLNIAFRDVKGLEREPVVAILYQMRQLVERILLAFEGRFFT